MIYCKNIMDVAHFFFFTPPQILKPLFFPPFLAMLLPQLLQFFLPISTMTLPQLVCHNFFFFFFHFGHSKHTSHPGSRNWVEEFRYSHYRNSTFSLSPLFSFSLILFVEFRQWWYRNSFSFFIILNNFEQFL